ncbi:MAG: aminotransferase class I/II-fold pyridoxal phosphate-dependent enzyme [Methanogenium sp.]|nr:aminotransferase class I/II-fold pyridoxal phosphate-dependent enzyme [Methanogenium sp.]
MKDLDKISKAHQFTESVIREMTRLSLEHDAINLAQGFPDFPAPDELKKAACDAVRDDYNQYAITWGAKDLRCALSEKVSAYNRIDFNPETEVTVTCGSTEAMISTMLAHVNPGEEVVVIEPFYENYGPDSIISGAVPQYVRLSDDLRLNEDELVSVFNRNTKAIVLNSPNNPTGKVFSKTEMKVISDLCVDYNAIAITDEIYEHILYDGRKHISIGSFDEMRERTVTIGSFSKTYSVTGWRVGYAIACGELTDPIRKIHDFLTVGAPAPLQHACVTALSLPASYYTGLVEMYDKKRKILYDGLVNAGFTCSLPEGAYYIMADISDFGMGDVEFARYLVKEIGVAPVPGSSFYVGGGHDKVRFTFSKKDETLNEACNRLESMG